MSYSISGSFCFKRRVHHNLNHRCVILRLVGSAMHAINSSPWDGKAVNQIAEEKLAGVFCLTQDSS